MLAVVAFGTQFGCCTGAGRVLVLNRVMCFVAAFILASFLYSVRGRIGTAA